MDVSVLARSLEMKESDLVEFVRLFMEVTASDLLHLEDGVRQGDAREVRELAHSIKGAAANLRLMDICEAAKRIEALAIERHLESIPEIVGMIKEKLDQLAQSLRGEEAETRRRQAINRRK